MNILIISGLFPPEPGISAKISYDIAEELSKNNSVTVICPSPSRPLGFKFPDREDNSSFNVYVLDSYTCPESKLFGRFWESISFGWKSKEFIKQNSKKIDAIYMNAWPLFGQFLILRTAMKHHIKVICHVQDIYPESLSVKFPLITPIINWLLIPLDRAVLSMATKIIAISEKMKTQLMATRRLSDEKIEVIRNWQDENSFRKYNLKSTNKKFTFMYLGNISPAAGIELLIHAFHHADLQNSQLIIAGSGSDLINCKKIVNDYEDISICFMDAPSHLVPNIQSKCDVLLLPLKKGIGLTASPSKLPAYMFSQKPIIACVDKDSDTADTIYSAKCGWVSPPEDKDSLIQIMRMVIDLPYNELQQKGKNGFVFGLENFSKINNLRKLANIISKIS